MESYAELEGFNLGIEGEEEEGEIIINQINDVSEAIKKSFDFVASHRQGQNLKAFEG